MLLATDALCFQQLQYLAKWFQVSISSVVLCQVVHTICPIVGKDRIAADKCANNRVNIKLLVGARKVGIGAWKVCAGYLYIKLHHFVATIWRSSNRVGILTFYFTKCTCNEILLNKGYKFLVRGMSKNLIAVSILNSGVYTCNDAGKEAEQITLTLTLILAFLNIRHQHDNRYIMHLHFPLLTVWYTHQLSTFLQH